ncbi:hypothetical protein Trco_004328 [Trichoderma cornu-damae]|uniref:Scaffold protein Nfu/NifU N-terminal domain-containing protein n=1 Tax=Trichoderma cornu-damae TaxID=654480 RepID=A0A9P8QKJ0_9HYPO|nr:hypothetical protein Trco_004328 [Trichoderma cornu-damae]
MASLNMHRTVSRLVAASVSRPLPACQVRAAASRWSSSQRHLSTGVRLPAIAAGSRPRARKTQRVVAGVTGTGSGVRTIFIQTENTPNPDALKFLPNHRIIPQGMATPFIEYLNPRSTISPPHPSPLAARLMNIDGITSVFYGADFITVTKAGDANWAHVRPEIFALITEAITSGETIVNVVERKGDGSGEAPVQEDSLAYNEDDSEVVGMIKELLETRIRPAIQEDGGDIEFRGFEDGQVLLKLRGACRTCDSSTVTLKNGIEGMLMHYIEEVQGVKQILDEEEEISLQEFAKFEEKLKQSQKSAEAS